MCELRSRRACQYPERQPTGASEDSVVRSRQRNNRCKRWLIICRGNSTEINQIKANRDGTKLATCSEDRTARVWDISLIRASSPAGEDFPGLGITDLRSVVLEGHEKGVSTITWQPALVEGVPELLATYVSCPFVLSLSD